MPKNTSVLTDLKIPRIMLATLEVIAFSLSTGCVISPKIDYDFTGRVTKIVDGDTFYMTGQPVRIRIWGLSAPESRKPGGPEATLALSALIADQKLGCVQHHVDRYGRPVAQCYLTDGRDIAAEMIRSGVATEYCRYSRGEYGHC
ncbi:thermonuclease family protein [Methylobacterium sp.]|uniref:thermonuclease family protein n=1 Tax=Methylobacterium sp. TaxID=409 RepID=UPI003C71218A